MITRRFTLNSAAALLASNLLQGFLPGAAHAAGKPVVIRVPITFANNGMPLVKLMLDGKGPYTFLIDTGAFASGIRDSLAQSLGLHQGGSVHVSGVKGTENIYVYPVHNIVIGGGLPLAKMDFIGMDKFQMTGVDGILSASFLTALPSQLDYENHEIRYYLNGAEMDLAGFQAVTALYQSDQDGGTEKVYVEITVGGKKLLCLLDTGAAATILVGSTFVSRNHLWDAYPLINGNGHGSDVTGGKISTRIVRAPDMTMGDIHLDTLPVTLVDPKADDNLNSEEIDGLVGTPFLSKFTLAFSGREKIYFRPNAEFVLASGLMPDLDVPATIAPGTGVVPFMYGDARRILIPGYIGDKPTFACLLDTAGVSAITPEHAAAEGLPTLSDGSFDGGGLTFGTVRLPHLKLRPSKNASVVKTLLGLDFLTSLPTQIDFESNLLTFYIAADPDLTGYTKIGAVREVRDKSGDAKLYVTVKLDGLTTQCRIDTGYPMGVYLPPQTVKSRILWDIFPDAQNRQMRSDTGNVTRTRFVVMKGLEIGGTTIDKVPVTLCDPTQPPSPDDQAVDAVIGMGILHRFGIIFDKTGNVWFKPNRFIAG